MNITTLINNVEGYRDSFEGESTWGSEYSTDTVSYDSSVKRTGSKSGQIDNPCNTEKYVHSDIWTPIIIQPQHHIPIRVGYIARAL